MSVAELLVREDLPVVVLPEPEVTAASPSNRALDDGEARRSIQGGNHSVAAGNPTYELQQTPNRNEAPNEKGQADTGAVSNYGMQTLRKQPQGISDERTIESEISSKVEGEDSGAQGQDSEAREVQEVPESNEAGRASSGLYETVRSDVAVQSVPQQHLAQTLDSVVAFLRRYIVLPIPEQYDLLACWIAHTYVHKLFHFTPYLIIRSPEPECGKSTLLDALKLLSHAAWQVVVPTPAVLYRKIEAHKPTLLIDEFDTIYDPKVKSEANEILRGTLNAGFERGVVIPRCDGPKNELLEFSPYCPKALAGIGRLPETVESRAFIIPIVRLGHDETVEEYDEEIAPEEARPIAEALRVWAGLAGPVLKASDPKRPIELKPRQRNISKPLLAIADLAGGDWPDRARDAIVKVCAKEKLISNGSQLLGDIRSIMLTKSIDKITTTELLEYLIRVEHANSPWPVWWENDLKRGQTHGPAKRLATMLKAFEIEPRTLRFADGPKKGYAREDFLKSWSIYLEPAKAETAELDLDLGP